MRWNYASRPFRRHISASARILLTATLQTLALTVTPGPATAQDAVGRKHAPFVFSAIGDMPYELPREPVKFDRLVEAINRAKPAFTLHVGDIIAGTTQCSDEHFQIVKDRFERFNHPLIYTPGDNEWTDCHRLLGGRYDPLERLAKVRRVFFTPPELSLGRKQLRLVSQGRVMAEKHALFIENRRFKRNGILFITVHVVGSNNNMRPTPAGALAEFKARNQANLAWIEDAFAVARRANMSGVVFAWQGNVHRLPRFKPTASYSKAFTPTIEAIERGAARFARPVLVISGDDHVYDVRPFLNTAKQPVKNVLQLQVFGAGEVRGVLVHVDPGTKTLFQFKVLTAPGKSPG